jgi:hypothetical protein
VHSKSSLPSQGSSLTSYPCPSRSILCVQIYRSSVRGHHLHSIQVHPSQHCVFKLITLRSRVITYRLFTFILVSTVPSNLSLFSQGSSLTAYQCPSQSALCVQTYHSSVKGHHLQAIHIHPSQHCALKFIDLQSGVSTYILSTFTPVSIVCS